MSHRQPQFTVGQLLIAVAAVAVVAGAVRLWGPSTGSLVAVGMMIAAAAWKRKLGELFTSADGVIWMSGVVLWLAAFPRFEYGPWGVEMNFANLAGNIQFSWDGMAWLVTVAPIWFGMLLAVTAFVGVLHGSTPASQRLRFGAIGTAIVAVSAIHLVIYVTSFIPTPRSLEFADFIAARSLLALAAVGACATWCRSRNARLAAVHLTVAGWILMQSLPVFWPPNLAALSFVGLAFWMILLASLSILAASAKTMAVAVDVPAL